MLADVRDGIVPYLTQSPPCCAYLGHPYVGPMPYVGPSDIADRVPMLAHVKHVVALAWPTTALGCADLALCFPLCDLGSPLQWSSLGPRFAAPIFAKYFLA